MSDIVKKESYARLKAKGFTDAQCEVILDDGDLIVSAGAGSGKTTVMIARVIEKIKAGAKLDDMLIVTFTRASAADMRAKLSDKLVLALETCADAEEKRLLEDAAEAMPTCKIGTLHSFCQRLIKTYFYVIGADPTWGVCEDGEAKLMLLTAAERAVRDALTAGDRCFSALYDMFSSRRTDKGAVEAVARIAEFALSMPDPQHYLNSVAPDRELFPVLDGIIAERTNELASLLGDIVERCRALGMVKHIERAQNFFEALGCAAVKLQSCPSYKPVGTAGDGVDAEFKSVRKRIKKLCDDRAELAKAKEVDSAPYIEALLAVARDAYARYTERKKRLGKHDYSDLEHGAYAILCDGICLGEISENIKYVFIDEFQDVNPLQSEIAAKLKAAGAEMFLVGDIKQSIYGFRCCSPKHFARARKDGGYKNRMLTDNFRSSAPVIDFINKVFDGVMTESFGGADYKEERLVCGNTGIAGGEARFYRLPENKQAKLTLDSPPYSVRDAAARCGSGGGEAAAVADRIIEIIKEEGEPAFKSIAVLLRSFNASFCADLVREFDLRGIPYRFGNKSSVKEYAAAVALVDIMRCADDSYDDVALYTALRSPMGGFSDGELARLAAVGEKYAVKLKVVPDGGKRFSFHQKVKCYRGELLDKLNAFFALRRKIVDYSKNHDASDVLGFITANTDYFRHVYETGGNAQAVQALIDYAAERKCDMHSFISYYDTADFKLDAAVACDAVTVTTVHSSKGLEYGHVIVADTARGFNMSDLRRRYVVSERGVAVNVPCADGSIVKSAPMLLEKYIAPGGLRQEELRLLYVALTRAIKTLTVVATRDKACAGDIEGAGRLYDFLVNVLPTSPPPPVALGVESAADENISEEIVAAVKRRQESASAYPASELPVKTCVTKLAHYDDDPADYTRYAKVLVDEQKEGGESGEDARARGIAYHRAMELIDFSCPDLAAVEDLCENFELIDEDKILKAAKTVAELTAGAAFVGRERYFIADLPPEVTGAPSSVLVQGVIDLLAVDENGNATVLDYKTGDPARLTCDAYLDQLRLYAAAVEASTPFKVVKKYLYSFESGELAEAE